MLRQVHQTQSLEEVGAHGVHLHFPVRLPLPFMIVHDQVRLFDLLLLDLCHLVENVIQEDDSDHLCSLLSVNHIVLLDRVSSTVYMMDRMSLSVFRQALTTRANRVLLAWNNISISSRLVSL